MLISVFTRALHWPLSWARWIQFIPRHTISLRFILILHLRPGLLSYLFWCSHQNLVCIPPSSPCVLPALLLIGLIILIVFEEGYKLWSSSLMQFSPTSSHFISLRHPVLKHPQCALFPKCHRASFTEPISSASLKRSQSGNTNWYDGKKCSSGSKAVDVYERRLKKWKQKTVLNYSLVTVQFCFIGESQGRV
jgi:hypothetical protein